MTRPFRQIAAAIRPVAALPDRTARMQAVADALWHALAATGVSWVGFYLPDVPVDGPARLVLGPRRDKPACSPIGLHGVCGQAFTQRRPMVVKDVATLGANYVACDPRDFSEVVVPLLESNGGCWGVLDLDSHELGAFDDADVTGLQEVLRAARLMAP